MFRHTGPKTRYQMREKLASIGDDSWIEDDGGNKVFKVNGKAMRIRDTFLLEDAQGNEVAKIQERKLHVRDTMAIERGGKKIATVHHRLVGLPRPPQGRDRGRPRHEGAREPRGPRVRDRGRARKVAEISKKWFRVRDTYGVEIEADQDVPMILAITVAVEDLTSRRGD